MKSLQPISEIGRGGFGVVERVTDDAGSVFARKTFQPAYYILDSDIDQLRLRFKREVTIQKQLGGSEIMPVLHSDLNGKFPCFVMPLADKTYEQKIIEDKVAGSVDIDAIADILNALEFLHDKGFVHRDLNPKNILHHDSRWKLSDLGAVLPPSGQTVTLTNNTVIYTESYCAPEQKNSFHRVQASADVYSFGCILHDIFGNSKRVPYGRQTAPGTIGVLIGKCTEQKPQKRPSIKILRNLLLAALVDIGGHYKVSDKQSEEWLLKVESVEMWTENELDNFANFFDGLDIEEREEGHHNEYVYSLSTPFLTKLKPEFFSKILKKDGGVVGAIVDKYCEWAKNTQFDFYFADTICACLNEIFDSGDAATKAVAATALLTLGYSHNRFHVMRCLLRKCAADKLSEDLAERLVIEIVTDEKQHQFKSCAQTVEWEIGQLHSELAKLCRTA